jgi:N-acetylneuraminic acid mutarotase
VLVKLYSDGISLFSSVELWKYNSELDTWEKQATYPGEGVERFATFVVGGKLYMGGGINKADSWINVNDFWAYDFKLKTWTKKIDIPQIISQNLVSSCYSPTAGFAFTKYRELYQYNPVSDTWSALNSLNGGPTTRFTTTILYNNNKLYVVSGGSYDSGVWSSLRDTWSYDLDTNIWSLRDVFDKNLADGTTPTFMYKGKIYVGFGMQYYDETKFFIEINP